MTHEIRYPNQVSPVTPIERMYSDFSEPIEEEPMRTDQCTPTINPADNFTFTKRIRESETTLELNRSKKAYAGTGIDGGPETEEIVCKKLTVEIRDNDGAYAEQWREIDCAYNVPGYSPMRTLYLHGRKVGRTMTYEMLAEAHNIPVFSSE